MYSEDDVRNADAQHEQSTEAEKNNRDNLASTHFFACLNPTMQTVQLTVQLNEFES